MRWVVALGLAGAVLVTGPLAHAKGPDHPNEGHRPEDGPTRVGRLFPKPTSELPQAARDHALGTVVHNLTKDARNAKSKNAPTH